MTDLRDAAESATAGVPVVLREAAERASTGEWREVTHTFDTWPAIQRGFSGGNMIQAPTVEQARYDAAYIIAAQPQNVIALLDELDTAMAEIERLTGAIEDHVRARVATQSALTAAQARIADLEADRQKVHELSASLRDRSTFDAPTCESAQEIVLLSSPLPRLNAEPTNSPLSPAVKEPPNA